MLACRQGGRAAAAAMGRLRCLVRRAAPRRGAGDPGCPEGLPRELLRTYMQAMAGPLDEDLVRYQFELFPPDMVDPVVPDSLGAPKGLHPLEHAAWSLHLSHPLARVEPAVDADLRLAIERQVGSSPEEIDRYRHLHKK